MCVRPSRPTPVQPVASSKGTSTRMDQWFISDTHFGHANIIRYSNRPYKDVDEMNEMMIQEWNKLVKPGDLVYHNGDFAFLPTDKLEKLLRRLSGSIHLVLGNHDKDIIKNRNQLLKQGKLATIQHYNELNVDGQKIILFHYGCRVWNKSHHGSILLYCHSHGGSARLFVISFSKLVSTMPEPGWWPSSWA